MVKTKINRQTRVYLCFLDKVMILKLHNQMKIMMLKYHWIEIKLGLLKIEQQVRIKNQWLKVFFFLKEMFKNKMIFEPVSWPFFNYLDLRLRFEGGLVKRKRP